MLAAGDPSWERRLDLLGERLGLDAQAAFITDALGEHVAAQAPHRERRDKLAAAIPFLQSPGPVGPSAFLDPPRVSLLQRQPGPVRPGPTPFVRGGAR